MKAYIVIASINELSNIAKLKDQLIRDFNEVKIIIIDEGDEKLRSNNNILLQGLQHEFYGPKERAKYFQTRFNNGYEKYLSIIPKKCHAETSFGFLVAWEEKADVIIEIDDDVKLIKDHLLIQSHIENLYSNNGVTVNSKSKWYNTIENLQLNNSEYVFPRGHPYDLTTRSENYSWIDKGDKCILNMGLWSGNLDLDAITILYYGGLDGRCSIRSENLKRNKIIVNRGVYFAVCSMNTSFVPKIIPAFYQLYMNFMAVDRFDDIWSGIFIKKIADQIGDKVCLGRPLVHHDKRPRNTFKDLRSELEGIVMNEVLWRIVDSLELNGKDYYVCYQELINGLENNLNKFSKKPHRNFIKLQVQKMRIWLSIINKLE